KVGEGAFLGSIAALIEGEVRSATTVASGHVQLGVLDAQRLTAEFSKMSLSFRNLMISLDKRLRQVTDHAVRLYEQKDNLKEYLAGKRPLIKQGDDEERIFTITQGEADIIRKTDKAYVPMARLSRGDFLGRIPFLDLGHEPDSASVFASQSIKVAPLNVGALQQEYDRVSTTIRNFIEYLSICVSVTSRVACLYKEKSIEVASGSN
ncbi:MAG: cyclic nucleotide-binding domain-containing protein, partial [Desulfobacterales bacterium]|nr:cyclic nucleotide-binding domain-containing protein [Desulfobacterales bacterium]